MKRKINEIIIIADRNDLGWHESASKIEKTLQDAANGLSYSPKILRINIGELISFLSSLKYEDTICFICHPTDKTVKAFKQRNENFLWIFVSGGERPIEKTFLFDIKTNQSIWFSGIYGREDQFKQWLLYWSELGFTNVTFEETKEALFSGKTGIGITADRLRKNLVPLLITLEGYQAIAEKSKTESTNQSSVKEKMHQLLIDSLKHLWDEEKLFKELSKDASLLYGAIKNWSPSGRESQSRLTELLNDFLPEYSGHWTFDPYLDESIRHLINNKLESSKVDDALSQWYKKLSELSNLIEKLPDYDTGKKNWS